MKEVESESKFAGMYVYLVRDVDGVDTLQQGLGVLGLGVSTDHDLASTGKSSSVRKGEVRPQIYQSFLILPPPTQNS